jgi:hypothetical protein
VVLVPVVVVATLVLQAALVQLDKVTMVLIADFVSIMAAVEVLVLQVTTELVLLLVTAA